MEILVETTLDDALKNNLQRGLSKQVEEAVITRSFSKLEEGILPQSLKYNRWKAVMEGDCEINRIFLEELEMILSQTLKPKEDEGLSVTEREIQTKLTKENLKHQVKFIVI